MIPEVYSVCLCLSCDDIASVRTDILYNNHLNIIESIENRMWKFVILFCLSMLITVEANADIVTNLPGLSWKLNFKHYSGYLQSTGTKRLHYWFIESANNPAKAPVVLWVNGGPGCSSMEGLLAEHGPFLVSADGITLKQNPYSWNKVANMLYLESPAGVGYSYSSDKRYKTSDKQVAKDNYVALKNFFQLYPNLKANDFYITGESYGGIYVPTLSVLVSEDKAFNFKGFAVGNGLSSFTMNDNSLVYFAYYHGLYGEDLWNVIVTNCCKGTRVDHCDFEHSQDAKCQAAVAQVSSLMIGLNIYNLYAECYHPELNLKSSEDTNTTVIKVTDLWLMKNFRKHNTQNLLSKYTNLKVVPPCVNSTALTTYMNNRQVRHAIHIPDELPEWEICSGPVGSQYVHDYENMTAQYKQLLSTEKYHILVYNGDVDMACNFFGDEWFVDSLGQKLLKPWTSWVYQAKDGSDQIAGYVKKYENISFVTIKGSGHMVPTDKPRPALQMFINFINKKF